MVFIVRKDERWEMGAYDEQSIGNQSKLQQFAISDIVATHFANTVGLKLLRRQVLDRRSGKSPIPRSRQGSDETCCAIFESAIACFVTYLLSPMPETRGEHVRS